jgi:hypothetical protein
MNRITFNLLEVETFLNELGVETREDDDSFRKFKDVLNNLVDVWDMTDEDTKKDIIKNLAIK